MVSKPRYGWWGYAKWMVRSYKGGTLMTREEIDAVDAAVEETKKLSDGAERLLIWSFGSAHTPYRALLWWYMFRSVPLRNGIGSLSTWWQKNVVYIQKFA